MMLWWHGLTKKTLVIQATFKALPILHRGIVCYWVEGERQKGARGGQQVIFLFPALHFFSAEASAEKRVEGNTFSYFYYLFCVQKQYSNRYEVTNHGPLHKQGSTMPNTR